ncbi:hypothetical protein T458_15540 [Brevibacillus panacihumi W25]|uniref:SLH domain-containing protein n=1 Tax=Brevibacillus panacihumi W25 TaxID=1408254 RepID=V6M142_9BACL|nr:hypothetical protein [Brevibacillus panacihumi]EST52391.1 hypothetical protein T458_15540 [Brevibacillus panacihumi W25]
MNKQKKFLQVSTAALLAAAIAFPQAAAAAGPSTSAVQPYAALAATPVSTDFSHYVPRQYGVQLNGTVSREAFAAALNKIVAQANGITDKEAAATEYVEKASGKLSVLEAVRATVKAAQQQELAGTYSAEKVKAAWAKAGLTYDENVSFEAAQELAAAIDLGLVKADVLKAQKPTGDVQAELAYQLLGKVAEFNGHAKNALGNISSDDIYGKVVQAWNESQIIKAGELQDLVDNILKQDLITGYNLKDAAFDPRFDPKRTITYGHSDIVHAIQLIGLLKSEGIDANVQLEPKTSAFIYLKEWGEPVQTENYQVVQIENGNYIAYSKEYDLSFEFASQEDKERFQPLVLQYAKKNDEEATGLLRASWWQPLYYSLTELKDYPVITNNYVQSGRHIVQTFSLNEDSPAVVNAFKKLGKEVEVKTYKFWVDQPFYNYLKGDDFK